jgi:transcriptional regulator with XRE-family HTH domain
MVEGGGRATWFDLPAARRAAAEGRYGAVLRLARTAANLTLEQAGQRAGYSAATLSRLETGRRQLTDVTVLRRLAHLFRVPPALFGLADPDGAPATDRGPSTDMVPGSRPWKGGDDPVRRRELLVGLATAPLAATAPAPRPPVEEPSAVLVNSLEDLLLRHRRPHPTPDDAEVDIAVLRQGLVDAKTDFQTSRYRALAAKLPRLVTFAQASATPDPRTQDVLAEIYNTVAHVLIKLEVPGLGWVAADRAMAAASAVGDPVTVASVTRNIVSLCRRDRRFDAAQQLALDAADQLTITGPNRDVTHLSLYGMLLCNAGYAAAQAGDRARSTELLNAADTAAVRLGADRNAHWTAFGPTNVTLHRVSAACALGDAGTAIDHAATVPAGTLRIPERQSRYWVDVARAYEQWSKPAKCYQALTIAERLAPEEVRSRPVVRSLADKLLTAPTTIGMTGLRDFATRVGATA